MVNPSPTSPATASRVPLLVGLLGALALFLVYYTFRQRHIWGSDSFGYLRLAMLFTEGRLTLPTEFPADQFPALVPMGFSLNAGSRVVPNYTPGYPLLLAVGQLLRLVSFVTPLVSVLSSVFLYRLLRDRARRVTAALLTIAWALMPTTVYGATMLMSDGVCTAVLLGALLAYRREKIAATGWLIGLAIAIRPTSVVFGLPFLFIVRWDRSLLRLALNTALPCALYALYNWRLFGVPWKTGYGDIASDFQASVFPAHFPFYLTQTAVVLTPVILLLAAIGLLPGGRASWREKVFCLLWPIALVLVYSFWIPGGSDRWWWTRFILPGLPLIYLLAGEGIDHLQRYSARAGLAALALVALVPLYSIRFGRKQHDLWNRDTGTIHYEIAQRVAALVPAGSFIGTTEHGSTFLLYTNLVPYLSVHHEAPELIKAALARGRHVYLLIEPWNRDHPDMVRLLGQFQVREIARFPELWGGLPLYEVSSDKS